MNYIGEINAFERWLEQNPLDTAPQLMMYKFYKLANKAGWAEWVTVDNLTLMAEMKTRREATIVNWRDKLIETGLLTYKKGRKGVPNKYKITSLFTCTSLNASKSEAQSVAQSAVQGVVQSVPQSVDLSKHKLKHKLEEKDTLTSIEKEKPPRVNFVKPTIAEIKAHCQERGSSVDASMFFNFYESKDWKIGKNRMTKWKTAITTWELRDKKNKQQAENPYLRGDLFDDTGNTAAIGDDFYCLPEFSQGEN